MDKVPINNQLRGELPTDLDPELLKGMFYRLCGHPLLFTHVLVPDENGIIDMSPANVQRVMRQLHGLGGADTSGNLDQSLYSVLCSAPPLRLTSVICAANTIVPADGVLRCLRILDPAKHFANMVTSSPAYASMDMRVPAWYSSTGARIHPA